MSALEGDKLRASNVSLEATGDPVKLDERCDAICQLSCSLGMTKKLLVERAPAPQLEAVRRFDKIM